ncbi:protease SohB [Bisgaard Taxon 45]
MWSDIATGYGLFILEILTILLVIAGIVFMIVTFKQHKAKNTGELVVVDLSEQYQEHSKRLREFSLTQETRKQLEKEEKKAEKEKAKIEKEKRKKGELIEDEHKPRLYVLHFKGDIAASATSALREEVSAIIGVAKPEDEVLVRLESPGGMVHGYGLAASQLLRLKQHGIKLTIAVDKVAASGGYMMACVADKIVAAPFAILGSVGVVAQIPNIHRLLKKHDVDVEVMTAGEYKRTMTVLGENTEKGKQKFQQELEDTHQLFKQFVTENRPQVDIEQIATGEHWFGQQALGLNLVDAISTSDDLILNAIKANKTVLSVKYHIKHSFLQKVGKQAEESTDAFLLRWLRRNNSTLL